jgi:Fe-S oxidoreductase
MTLDDFKDDCRRCGDCLDACSQYSDIKLIDSLIELLDQGKEIDFDVSRCLTCGSCELVCPEGLSLKELIKQARLAKIWKEGFSDINFMCDPSSDRNIFISAAKMEEPLVFEAREADTVYFPGCYPTYFHKTMIRAMVRLMQKAEVDFTVLNGVDLCCGVVAAGTGNPSVLKENGPRVLERLEELGAKRVVASCPGCFLALSKIYPNLFGDGGFEVIHASQFLLKLVEEGRLQPGEREGDLFYHDPCHLTRGAGIHREPRELLARIEGTNLINPDTNDSICCGFGGGVRVNHPSESISISRSEHEEVRRRGAGTIISNCAGCRQNLLEGRPSNGPDVYDLAEYLLLTMGETVERDDSRVIEMVNTAYERSIRGYERPNGQ